MAVDNTDLDDLDRRANNAADGMKINWDKFTRDTKRATEELRNWRAAFDRMKREGKAGPFDDLFGGAFKGCNRG